MGPLSIHRDVHSSSNSYCVFKFTIPFIRYKRISSYVESYFVRDSYSNYSILLTFVIIVLVSNNGSLI